MIDLPVDLALPDLLAAMERSGAVVLVAPPGSGKTTRVPPALADRGKVVVLQPRRVAARAAARRVAQERGWTLGERVGYRTRFESRSGPRTRVEFVTEGLLLRRLQRDPFLEDTATVVLDEFHERSLALDLCLALLADLRRDARPDLGLVVVSATLEAEPVAAFLDAPVLRADGRAFPVEIEHAARPGQGPLAPRVAAAVRRGLQEVAGGHALVFLPGVGEIRAVQAALGALPGVVVLPLHGQLPAAEQDRALAPSDRRKVVLSTNVAETSVTLEGATLVVDSGLARVPRFDAATGVTRLELLAISQASAEQRAGRAGRTGPGRCLRLWTEAEGASRPLHDLPAVRRSDLCDALLRLQDVGADSSFRWFEAPPPGLVDRAQTLLEQLGASREGRITPRGRTMLELPLHPRLAAVVLEGRSRGRLRDAVAAAALSAERDPFARSLPPGDVDLLERLSLLGEAEYGVAPPGVARGPLRDVLRARDQLLRAAGAPSSVAASTDTGDRERDLAASLLAGFPDRVAQRRSPDGLRLRLASGGGAKLPEGCPLHEDLLLAVALRARGRDREPTVDLALSLDPSWLATTEGREVSFDPGREAAVGRRTRRWGELVLDDRPDPQADPAALSACLLAEATAAPERALAPSEAAEALRARIRFLGRRRPDLGLPELGTWAERLPDLVRGRWSFGQLRSVDLSADLLKHLSWPQRQALDQLAPPRFDLPSGRSAAIRYPEDGPPVISARLQDFFGLDQTPTPGGQAAVLELLAPNRRPAQVTSDLPGFWRGSYAEVRKALRGRYPKHAWPEDPWNAPPIRRRR